MRLDNQFLYDWTLYPLPLNDLKNLSFNVEEHLSPALNDPAFYRGTFTVEEKADTFLRFDNWNKGVVFLNGVNLGRYWDAGPQRTLYVPAPLLKQGENELIMFELHGVSEPIVT